MKQRKANLLDRIKAALAVLTGRTSLFLGANGLEARWQSKVGEGNTVHLQLDITLNKVHYSAKEVLRLPDNNPWNRQMLIKSGMHGMVDDVMRQVLGGEDTK